MAARTLIMFLKNDEPKMETHCHQIRKGPLNRIRIGENETFGGHSESSSKSLNDNRRPRECYMSKLGIGNRY